MVILPQTLTVENVSDIGIGLRMSSKRISHAQRLSWLKNHLLKVEFAEAVDKYCPELGDEMVSSVKDIPSIVDRALAKFPDDVRKRFVND